MAIGFSPEHAQDVALDGLTTQEYLALAYEVVRKLNWEMDYINETGLIAFTPASEAGLVEEFNLHIEGDLVHLQSKCTKGEVIDWARHKSNIDTFLAEFTTLKEVYTPENLQQKYEELKPEIDQQPAEPKETVKERITGFLSMFVPRTDFFVTPILVDINILVFLLMAATGMNILTPDTETLIRWGADYGPKTLDGQWWRLITSVFIHIGVLHILMNMYALIYIGVLLEPLLGRTRYIAAYMLTGITASVASLSWHSDTVSAGASGAIFGLYGVFLAMLTTDLIHKAARNSLLQSIVIFVLYNLANGMKGGIDNAAHIGGLVGGIAIGYAYISSLRQPDNARVKYGTVGLLSIVIISGSFLAYKRIPNDEGTFLKKMQQFDVYEKSAVRPFQLPDGVPVSVRVQQVRDSSIYYFTAEAKLIEEVKQLNLPEKAKVYNNKLARYCYLRIQYSKLYCAMLEENNVAKYSAPLKEINSELEVINRELSNKQ